MDIEDLLNFPDGILLRKSAELNRFANWYTVALLFGPHPEDSNRKPRVCSGVLFQINNRFFVLSAGHCVKGISPLISSPHCTAMVISSQIFPFYPRFIDHEFVYDDKTDLDYGYLEIHPSDANTIGSKEKIFTSIDRITISTSEKIKAANDWLGISGYPGELIKEESTERNKSYFGVRFLLYTSTIAGVENVPASTIPVGAPRQKAIDVFVPHRGNVETSTGSETILRETRLPDLAGMSGGGCWKTNARPNPKEWRARKTKLIAIHIGRSEEETFNDDPVFFTREVLIGHHLSLIINKNPDLKTKALSLLPELENYED